MKKLVGYRITDETTVGELRHFLRTVETNYGDDSASIELFKDLSGSVHIDMNEVNISDGCLVMDVDE